LHSAALNGSLASLELLLARGADVRGTDVNGRTAEECARSKNNSCVPLFRLHNLTQQLSTSPAGWTKENMREVLRLCKREAPRSSALHEFEARVRVAVPALCRVWKDVLRYRQAFITHHLASWRDRVRQEKFLARTSAQIKHLTSVRLVKRALSGWRVLEREYCAWQRGFAASFELQNIRMRRGHDRRCFRRAFGLWASVLQRKQQILMFERQLCEMVEVSLVREAVARLRANMASERIKTFKRQLAMDHAFSCRLRQVV
jgi:hypothetical protein